MATKQQRDLSVETIEQMSPEERRQAFQDSIVTDLANAPAQVQRMVDRTRRRTLDRIAREEAVE